MHLLLGQQIEVTKARHIAAHVISLGVINPIPGIGHHFFAVTSQLAIVPEAWANVSIRKFCFINLMAVIATTAIRSIGFIAPSCTTTALGNALTGNGLN